MFIITLNVRSPEPEIEVCVRIDLNLVVLKYFTKMKLRGFAACVSYDTILPFRAGLVLRHNSACKHPLGLFH